MECLSTTADTYPYGAAPTGSVMSRSATIRNSVKILIDAFLRGRERRSTCLTTQDPSSPPIERSSFSRPCFADAIGNGTLHCASNVRYPELMLRIQAAVYGPLSHEQSRRVLQNREDLWSVCHGKQGVDGSAPKQPLWNRNFVLMTLPGRNAPTEFHRDPPRSHPPNRNKPDRVDWPAAATANTMVKAVVYDFPKSKLIDGPLQIEARIDQNATVVGTADAVEPAGVATFRGGQLDLSYRSARAPALLAEPILTCKRSTVRCRSCALVVLAVQDRLAYGPTFEIGDGGRCFAGAESLGQRPSRGGPARIAPSEQATRRPRGRQRADRRCGSGSVRLSATHGGGKAGRCWTEVGGLEAQAGGATETVR